MIFPGFGITGAHDSSGTPAVEWAPPAAFAARSLQLRWCSNVPTSAAPGDLDESIRVAADCCSPGIRTKRRQSHQTVSLLGM